jgi:hypothetical protein
MTLNVMNKGVAPRELTPSNPGGPKPLLPNPMSSRTFCPPESKTAFGGLQRSASAGDPVEYVDATSREIREKAADEGMCPARTKAWNAKQVALAFSEMARRMTEPAQGVRHARGAQKLLRSADAFM